MFSGVSRVLLKQAQPHGFIERGSGIPAGSGFVEAGARRLARKSSTRRPPELLDDQRPIAEFHVVEEMIYSHLAWSKKRGEREKAGLGGGWVRRHADRFFFCNDLPSLKKRRSASNPGPIRFPFNSQSQFESSQSQGGGTRTTLKKRDSV